MAYPVPSTFERRTAWIGLAVWLGVALLLSWTLYLNRFAPAAVRPMPDPESLGNLPVPWLLQFLVLHYHLALGIGASVAMLGAVGSFLLLKVRRLGRPLFLSVLAFTIAWHLAVISANALYVSRKPFRDPMGRPFIPREAVLAVGGDVAMRLLYISVCGFVGFGLLRRRPGTNGGVPVSDGISTGTAA